MALKPFLLSMHNAVASENSLAALSLALAMPDICASLEHPGAKNNGDRYAKWWDAYAARHFQSGIMGGDHNGRYLVGKDAYKLRCAFLHAGEDELGPNTEQHSRIQFIEPGHGMTGLDKTGRRLHIGVDDLVDGVSKGAETWIAGFEEDPDITARLSKLLRVMTMFEALDLFMGHVPGQKKRRLRPAKTEENQ